MDTNTNVFEKMPIPKALAKLAIPTIISQLIVMIYNLADTFFIGQTNDPYKVAATSMAYVLFFLLNALANLFGIGGGSLISRLLGIEKYKDARAVSAFSFYGTIFVTAIYSLFCFIFMNSVLLFMGASIHTLKFAKEYTFWVIVIGGIPATLSMAMSHLLRSAGYGGKAGFGLSMGGIINIILDPVFMFVLLPKGQEVIGAAVATMFSNVIALVYYAFTYYKLRNNSILSVSFQFSISGMRYAKQILAVGFPSALSTLLACISIMLTNNLASTYGDIPVAAIGIVKKVEMLPHNVGTGLCQGMIPLVAYNYASGNHKRMTEAINKTRLYGLIFTGCCIFIFEIFAHTIAYLFIHNAQTVSLTTSFLQIMCLATPLTICNFHMCYTLQAMGKGKESLFLSVCRQGIFNIPLLFMMNRLFHLYGVVWTQFIADAITAIISFMVYRKVMIKIEY